MQTKCLITVLLLTGMLVAAPASQPASSPAEIAKTGATELLAVADVVLATATAGPITESTRCPEGTDKRRQVAIKQCLANAAALQRDWSAFHVKAYELDRAVFRLEQQIGAMRQFREKTYEPFSKYANSRLVEAVMQLRKAKADFAGS